jgi:hypothetical protein
MPYKAWDHVDFNEKEMIYSWGTIGLSYIILMKM